MKKLFILLKIGIKFLIDLILFIPAIPFIVWLALSDIEFRTFYTAYETYRKDLNKGGGKI